MKKILPIIQLAAEFATVKRTIGYRPQHLENDAEHSYQLALVCWNANQQYSLALSDELILKYALVHDIVELYAGDVDAYGDQKQIAMKSQNEAESFQKLKQNYNMFSDMLHFIEQYEHRADAESQLVHMMDKFLPNINIYNAKSDAYKTRKIDFESWKQWLYCKINLESLDPKLKKIFEESVTMVEEHREVFYSAD